MGFPRRAHDPPPEHQRYQRRSDRLLPRGAFWNVPSGYSPQGNGQSRQPHSQNLHRRRRQITATPVPGPPILTLTAHRIRRRTRWLLPTKASRGLLLPRWSRDMVPGNGHPPAPTPASIGPATAAVKSRTQVAATNSRPCFYDGHVELLDDMAGMNPEFWWPKGTVHSSPANSGPTRRRQLQNQLPLHRSVRAPSPGRE